VKSSSDYGLAMAIQSVSFLTGAIFSYFIIFCHLKISFVWPSLKEMTTEVNEGFQIFLSTVGINFYRDSNILILGMLTNYTIVGYYAPAEKLIKAVQSVTAPFVNTLYPYFSRKFSHDKNSHNVFFKIGKYYNMVLLLLSVIVFLFAKHIIEIMIGTNFSGSVLDLRILSLVILFGGMNFYYGIIGMVNFDLSGQFTKFVWISGGISVVFCLALSLYFQDAGAAVSMVIAEALLFCLITRAFYKKDFFGLKEKRLS
jgi:PST family polysaccharide transporter